MKLLLFLSFCCFYSVLLAQPETATFPSLDNNGFSLAHFNELTIPRKVVEREDYQPFLQAFHDKNEHQIEFQPETRESGLIALAFYPELKNVKIRYVFQDIKTTLAVRPRFLSLFRGRDKRSFTIFVDKKVKNKEGILFESFPFNAQVGGLGHEYAHIIDYSRRSSLNIMWLGIKYLFSKKAKARLEHKIDRITIERGLGWQTLAWEEYIFHHSEASKRYKRYKKDFYLGEEKIREHMQKCELYESLD